MKDKLNERFIRRVNHALEWGTANGNSRDYVQYLNGLSTGLEDALSVLCEEQEQAPALAEMEHVAVNPYMDAVIMAADIADRYNEDPAHTGVLDLEYKFYPGLKTKNVQCNYFLPDGVQLEDGASVYFFEHLEEPGNMAALKEFIRTGVLPDKGVD